MSSIHSFAIIFRYFSSTSDFVPALHLPRSIALINRIDSYLVHLTDIFTSARALLLLVY